MFRTPNILIIFFVVILGQGTVGARELTAPKGYELRHDTLDTKIYFRVGRSDVDWNFRDNGRTVTSLTSRLHDLCSDTSVVITRINVRAGTSPEGNTDKNKRLSEQRVTSIVSLLKNLMGSDGRGIPVNREALGIDWRGLRDLAAGCGQEWGPEAAAIIDTVPEWIVRGGKVVDGRKLRLMKLRGCTAWWWMLDHLFPELRGSGSSVTVEYIHVVPAVEPLDPAGGEAPVLTADTAGLLPPRRPLRFDRSRPRRTMRPVLSFSSNMLFDAALIPNMGMELRLPSQWAFRLSGSMAWWSSDPRHRFYRYRDVTAEVSRYFFRPSGSGHHIGVYGKALTFDFEFGNRGWIARHPVWSAGITYGYYLPLSRYFALDFFISGGWAGGKYEKYFPDAGCYVWLSTHKFNYVLPTDLGVRLIWNPAGHADGGFSDRERRRALW